MAMKGQRIPRRFKCGDVCQKIYQWSHGVTLVSAADARVAIAVNE
jgi:hypothetical protein